MSNATLNDDAFARLVAEDVKNRVTDEQRKYLRLPENWQRWREALLALIDTLHDQLSELEAQKKQAEERYGGLGEHGLRLIAEAQTAIDERRKKIERFKYHVENRLAEVDRMIALGDETVSGEIKLLDFLRKAITTHRNMTLAFEYEPTEIDEALWAALEGRWNFDDIERP